MNLNDELKIGYYRNGILTIDRYDCKSDNHIVYAIKISDDIYIGSTHLIRKRLHTHLSELRSGKHDSKYMQESFDKCLEFDVYILMLLGKSKAIAQFAEQGFMQLLNPKFNNGLPKGHINPFIDNLWNCERT